jgi:long-chain fatty acid transport protein
MTTFRPVRVALSLVIATFTLATAAAAQTNDEIFPTLQWNFSTPGARANGMGRTFIGMADDASAAVTNPAGLMSLTRPQIYAEYKNTRLQVDRLATRTSLTTIQPTTNTSIVNALSFLSVSAPINRKLAVGFSIHRFLDYHEAFSLDARPIPNEPGARIFFPVLGQADFTATAFGGSVAYMVTEAFRVGVTVAANSFKANSTATRFDFLGDLSTTNIIVNQTSINDTQTAVSASLGVLYRASDLLSVGFTYGKSPKFNTSENLQTNPGFRTLNTAPFGTNQPLTTVANFPAPVQINVPDHFGAGVAIRPNTRLLIAADAVRMNYSSLSKNTAVIFQVGSVQGTEYVTPDVTELHLGAEYNVFNMMQKFPVFVRAGVYTNPNHLVTYTPIPATAINAASVNASEIAKYNLLPREDETRGTVGVGFVFTTRFQVDVAYVFRKEVVASTAVRF